MSNYRAQQIVASLIAPARKAGLSVILLSMGLIACDDRPWNRPYPADSARENIFYSLFQERPKHLDPAQSYSSNEVTFTGQIYEPPLQYHYLKRPYELIPLTATGVPVARYLDIDGNNLPDDSSADDIAYSIYDIRIESGIKYQPHPAFARDEQGKSVYDNLTADELSTIHVLGDFTRTGTHELTAADYIYQIKRLAHPQLHSPIFGLMSEYIVGLETYAATLKDAWEKVADGKEQGVYLDLTQYPLEGVELFDRYTYRIKINGKYPQLLYWLAMPFFGPLPKEGK